MAIDGVGGTADNLTCQVLTCILLSRFVSIDPLYTPTSDGKNDNIFITRSYDATSHFETVAEDVMDVWQRIKVRGVFRVVG